MADNRNPGKRTRREDDNRRSQLLEGGEGPRGPVGSFAGSDTRFTTEGGPGTNTPNRWGGWLRPDRNSPPNPRHANTGGDAGYSTLGGGTYYGEGDPDDAPGYGDWGRNATGAGSGARGRPSLTDRAGPARSRTRGRDRLTSATLPTREGRQSRHG